MAILWNKLLFLKFASEFKFVLEFERRKKKEGRRKKKEGRGKREQSAFLNFKF
jgi:hypothetical protein